MKSVLFVKVDGREESFQLDANEITLWHAPQGELVEFQDKKTNHVLLMVPISRLEYAYVKDVEAE